MRAVTATAAVCMVLAPVGMLARLRPWRELFVMGSEGAHAGLAPRDAGELAAVIFDQPLERAWYLQGYLAGRAEIDGMVGRALVMAEGSTGEVRA